MPKCSAYKKKVTSFFTVPPRLIGNRGWIQEDDVAGHRKELTNKAICGNIFYGEIITTYNENDI